MYHLMIVDDEERARTGIRSLINWQEHGVAIVAEARDGAEALELLELHDVDIMLTDIRMPHVDGLRLIDTVNKQYPHIKTIIMSGYNDFSYAQEALKLGASDYLLKPSRKQEILAAVLKLIGQVEDTRLQASYMERLKDGFRESLPLLREKSLGQFILAEEISRDKLLNNLKLSGLTFAHRLFGVLVVQIDNLLELQRSFGAYDLELLKYGLANIAEETFKEANDCVAFENQDQIVLILNADEPRSAADLLPIVSRLQENARQYLKLSLSIGYGGIGAGIERLRHAYLQAVNALDSRFYIGPGKTIDYEEAHAEEAAESEYPFELEKLIIQAILSGDTANITDKIGIFQQTLIHKKHAKEPVLKFSFALYFTLYRIAIDKDLSLGDIFGHNLDQITHELAKSTIENIHNLLLRTALLISERLQEKKQGNKLFDAVLAFIRNNYNKEISRETVANEVYITPGYLSLLFKQQLKTSFLDFLHKIRIEQAGQLLKDQSRKVSDIANEVGYNDEKYFFQVFKKYTGMTPKQYRNTIQK